VLRRSVAVFLVVALLAATVGAASPNDKVAYNVKTHVFHCLTCYYYVKRCTANCIVISRAEALKRGGRACKVCGGTCTK
jgi:hypothetical protein